MNQEEYTNITESAFVAGQAADVAKASAAAQYFMDEKDKSIAEAQLEVDITLDKLYHLLKQDMFRDVGKGKMDWVTIPEYKRNLTDEGVDRIMQTMNFYINKENLLSNFSEDQINRIMLAFNLALNANFFMKYNIIFRSPTLNECKDVLQKRLQEKIEVKKYALEIAGLEVDEKLIRSDMFKEIENRIEHELQKIKENKKKENLMEWELLFTQLSQIVLATLNRAWKGEERGSLRRHTNISEVLSKSAPMPKEGGRFRWLGG